ncbi:MAG: flagellar hook-length control protein FliK, partial [Pseudomonadota bacterium]
ANAQAKGEALTAPDAAGRAASAGAATASGQTRATLPPYVVRQVGDQMAQMVQRQQSTLRLELKPPTLGELHVELAVKEGVVKATLTAETVAAKQALEAGLEQLKQELAQQGLKVERIEIVVDPDAERREAQAQAQAGFGQDGRQGRERAAAAGGAGEAGAAADETAIPAWQFNPANSRVNLFA